MDYFMENIHVWAAVLLTSEMLLNICDSFMILWLAIS